ncbi:hypothetical protein ACWF94_12890 [Streptomyces sp. NPDC055078]
MNDSGFAVFGTEVATALAEWQRNTGCELEFIEPLDGAGSGARLVYAYVEDPRPDHRARKLILKLCAPDEGARFEAGHHRRAWQSGPVPAPGGTDFPTRHLVAQEYDPLRVAGTWLMFQRIAFDRDGRELTALKDVPSRQARARVGAAVVRSILEDWNPDERRGPGITPELFVDEIIGAHRLRSDSALKGWLRRNVPDAERAWITLPGRGVELPNPLPLAEASPLAGRRLPYAARGRAHGDLHPGNIMVVTVPQLAPERYRLVDLSRFSPGALLARDPVHLMLCLLADYLPGLPGPARDQLLGLLTTTGLSGEPEPPSDLVSRGLHELLDTMAEAPANWLYQRQVTREWQFQRLLALQACALMFVARESVGERERWWFLELAARACAAFLRVTEGLGAPRQNASAPPPDPAASPPDPAASPPDPAASPPDPAASPPAPRPPSAGPGEPPPGAGTPLHGGRGGPGERGGGQGAPAGGPGTAGGPGAAGEPPGAPRAPGSSSGAPAGSRVAVPAAYEHAEPPAAHEQARTAGAGPAAPALVAERGTPAPVPALTPTTPTAVFEDIGPELRRRLAECSDPGRDRLLRESLMIVIVRCDHLRKHTEALALVTPPTAQGSRPPSGPAAHLESALVLITTVLKAAERLRNDAGAGVPRPVLEESRSRFTGALHTLLDQAGAHLAAGERTEDIAAPGRPTGIGGARIDDVFVGKRDAAVLLGVRVRNHGGKPVSITRATIRVLRRSPYLAAYTAASGHDVVIGTETDNHLDVAWSLGPGERDMFDIRVGFTSQTTGCAFEAKLILDFHGEGRMISDSFAFDSCFD